MWALVFQAALVAFLGAWAGVKRIAPNPPRKIDGQLARIYDYAYTFARVQAEAQLEAEMVRGGAKPRTRRVTPIAGKES